MLSGFGWCGAGLPPFPTACWWLTPAAITGVSIATRWNELSWSICSASFQSQSALSMMPVYFRCCSQVAVSCLQPEYSGLLMSCQMVEVWVCRGVVVSNGLSRRGSLTDSEHGFGSCSETTDIEQSTNGPLQMLPLEPALKVVLIIFLVVIRSLCSCIIIVKLFQDPQEKFKAWRQQYGDIFSLQLGCHTMVVISSYQLLKEAFVKHGDVFSHRPDMFVMVHIGKKRGNLCFP